jgi:hypothetical protein
MELVGVAAGAILLPLHPLGVKPLVLAREVVAILTVATREDDFISRHYTLSSFSFQFSVSCRVLGEGSSVDSFGFSVDSH